MYINQDNYEQFFLDHAEGNLSPEMERELTDFLEANPDLKPVLKDFDPSPLPFEEFNNDSLKKRLKKNIHPTGHIDQDNVDEWMIRDVEGLLNEAEENELKEFLSLNPAYSFDHKLFGYTKLLPDLSISYRRKNELKKEGAYFPVKHLFWLLPSAAAVILLFIGIRFFQQPEVKTVPPVNLNVSEIPESKPSQIAAQVSIPEMKKEIKAIKNPSRDQIAEIARSISFRLKPFADQASIAAHPTEDVALSMSGRKSLSIITIDKKEPSLIARVFSNMLDQARGGIRKQANFDKILKPDFNFWSFAKAGISGYNSISDRDLELYMRKDEDGKVKSYALIDQDRLLWSKDLNKE
ncbi:MAG: hypothetical protein M0Q51_02920 [Bacteroidales bacterium]|nr:hypothetical protein [Bacteroidales bacterium]